MKSILISIKPKYVADILNGKKTLEIRKTMPKCDLPIDVYIYCSKGKNVKDFITMYKRDLSNNEMVDACYINGTVIAKFTLRTVEPIRWRYDFVGEYKYAGTKTITREIDFLNKSCLCDAEIDDYLKDKKGFAWHIDNLEIFGKPKELSSFFVKSHKVKGIDRNGKDKDFIVLKPLTKPFQSWGYIEV